MSVDAIIGENHAVLFCNTTDWAFGPIFYVDDENIHEFIDWCFPDPRTLTETLLANKHSEWKALKKCTYCEKREGDLTHHEGGNLCLSDLCEDCRDLHFDEDGEIT